MTHGGLHATYRRYIDCPNLQAWDELPAFVHDRVVHNGRPVGVSGYREMLEADVERLPDLRSHVDLLVCDAAVLSGASSIGSPWGLGFDVW